MDNVPLNEKELDLSESSDRSGKACPLSFTTLAWRAPRGSGTSTTEVR